MSQQYSNNIKASELEAFVSLVWKMGHEHKRSGLPWRSISDAYGVYVSEVMLQQTQVSRVLKYWNSWMAAFPTLDALASASTSDILERWQGLGYNRRALALKKSAEVCACNYAGKLPTSIDELEGLPGVGPATAAGIMAFAYQQPSIYIETNVRSVFIHHFFSDTTEKVPDILLKPLVEATCSKTNPRDWYYALLDYGAYLKSTGVNPSRAAASYTRQSAFEGSWRQKRAFVIREVLAQPGISVNRVAELLNAEETAVGRTAVDDSDINRLIEELSSEGFFQVKGARIIP